MTGIRGARHTDAHPILEINDVAHQAPHGDRNAVRLRLFVLRAPTHLKNHGAHLPRRVFHTAQPRLTTTSVPVRFARHEAGATPSRRRVQQTGSDYSPGAKDLLARIERNHRPKRSR
jgi:hypothetical protein